MSHGDGGPDRGRKVRARLGPDETGWVWAFPDGTAEVRNIPFLYPYVNQGDIVPPAFPKVTPGCPECAKAIPIAVPVPLYRKNHAWESVRVRTKSLRKWCALMDRLAPIFKSMGVEVEGAKVGWLVMAAPKMATIGAAMKLFGFYWYRSVQLPPAVQLPQ